MITRTEIEIVGPLSDMRTCQACGAWLRKDEPPCGGCAEIERRNRERLAAAAEIGMATKDYTEARGFRFRDAASERLADALDHYITRSSQGWVR